jgi:drug/metabolite transporter (DMT)-like permease
MSVTNGKNARDMVSRMRIYGAKKGIVYALASGVFWGFDAVILAAILVWVVTKGTISEAAPLFLLMPLIFAMLHDASAGIFMIFFCLFTGKIREYARVMRTKPGWVIVLAAIFGGPLAMSGYLLGISMGGPYAVAITACFPAAGAIMGAIFLKEKIYPRVWFGMALVLLGSIIISWSPPEDGQYPLFYWGIALAVLSTIAWAIEGVLGTLGMDLVDSDLALGIRQLSSGFMYVLFIVPVFWAMFSNVMVDGQILLATFGVGCIGGIAYLTYFKGLNRTGVARGQALHVNYGLWYILFSWLLGQTEPTVNLWVGAVIAIIGIVFIVGNPKELFSLRNV